MINLILLQFKYRNINEAAAGTAIVTIGVFIVVAVALIPQILYLLTLQRTLNEVSTENRKMPPSTVWLLLIPLFNIVWNFIVVDKLADSLKAEFSKRNVNNIEERPGYTIGLVYSILICCCFIPILNIFAGLGAIVCWILYWVKIANFKTLLKQNNIN